MASIFPDLRRALEDSSEGIARLTDPETNQQFVVMSAELYQKRVGRVFDVGCTPAAETVDAVMRDDDANDPYLEQYQHYGANS
jgi:hypothetical protein